MEKNNNQSAESRKTGDMKSGNSASGIIIFLSVLAVLLAIGGAVILRQMLNARYEAQVATITSHQVADERDLILEELDELEEKYNRLTTEYQELDELLREEKRRVNQLRAQLRGGGAVSGTEATTFRERIAELEQELEMYREQMEMLQAENQILSGENSQIQTTLRETTSRNRELETKNQQLEEQVEKASILTISNLEGVALRERRRGDEPTDRARRADKLRVCFTINQNLVAEAGNRDFFIRLIDPSNQVLSISPDNTLEYEGETIQYSLRRTVNYQNNSQDVCVIWDQAERFEKGYYNVVVFAENEEVGYKLFQLD